jgi:hypothetical protein
MSATRREREEFLVRMAKENIPLDVARTLLRYSATLTRLAEAQCNGDWPADNGERKVVPCSRCESLWVRSSMVKEKAQSAATRRAWGLTIQTPILKLMCKDCRTAELVTALVTPYGIKPIFQGDPRGAVLKLALPSGYTDDMGREGVCVP